MSSSLQLALLLFTLTVGISTKLAVSSDQDDTVPVVTSTCRSYCGNITIDYPFGLHSGCGHSGFRDLLYCMNGMLMLHIPSGTYRVLDIDYAYNSLTLHDSSMSDCYSLTLSTTTTSTANGFVIEPWRAPYLSPAPDNVFMLLGCRADSPLFQGFPGKHLPCRNVSGMGCDEYYQCPAWGFSKFNPRKSDSAYGSVSPPGCCSLEFGAIRAINLTHLRCEGYSSAYSLAPLRARGPGAWSYGIRVSYSLPADHDGQCQACEATGGVCGYDLQTSSELCICPGGLNTTSTCDSVSALASTIKRNSSLMSLIWAAAAAAEEIKMARKKIREYDSKRLLKQHLKRIADIQLNIRSAQITESTDFNELASQDPWLSSEKLVVKPDMLFGKRGKSGLVALNLHLAQVASFVQDRLGKQVEIGGCKGPITTFIVEPFVPHDEEYYLNIVSERLGCSISFSECGGIEIEENWDKVKTVFIPTEASLTSETCAPLVATLPLEVKGKIDEFIKAVYALFLDLDFTFLEMNPFTLVDGNPYPLDMRGELDDTAAFKNFNKWGDIEFPMPFGRVMSATESFIHGLDEKVGDLGYASELGNYAEYSGAPKEGEVLQYARVVIDCATANPDVHKRALVIGGGISNFTDVAATFSGIIRALRDKEAKLKAARMNIYVRRGGPNYQTGLAKMRRLGEEIGIPIEVYGPEETMTGICKQAIECITASA